MLQYTVAQPHYYYTTAITTCFNCNDNKIVSILLCTDHMPYKC